MGDSDVIRPEHAVETFRLLPHAHLAILPATDHVKIPERTEWPVPMVLELLDATTMPRSGDGPPVPWESDWE